MLGLDKLIAPITGILDKFVVDKDLKMKLQHELETALHSAIEQDLPEFEFSQLSTVLMGMLGLGGLRTFEKMKGVSRE